MKNIRLGLAVVASPLEVGADRAPALLDDLQAALSNRGKLVLFPHQIPVKSVQDAVRAGREFYDKRVHAICIAAASWFEDYLVLDMLEECDVPVIIRGLPGMETGSLCGTQQLGYMLKQLSKPYKLLYGDLASGSDLKRLLEYASAAAVRYHLRRARIGYLGHRVEGMTETTGHELALKKVFGPRIVGIDSQVFLDGVARIESEAIQERWQEIKKRVGSVKCGDDDGLESLRVYDFMKTLIGEKMLNAVAVGCYPHLMGKVCLAASLLGEEGIPVACEGDVNGAMAMMMLSWLSSEPTHNTDLLNPIPEDNAIVFSHCGSGGFSLAKDNSEITLAPVRLMDRGLCCLFTAKPGPVTLVNIAPTMESYEMAVMEGMALETDMVFPGNPLKVRFESDYREVLSWIGDEGLGHHWMAAYGAFRQELADLADVVGCRFESIA
jgi:L-fucose isomerase-like protein